MKFIFTEMNEKYAKEMKYSCEDGNKPWEEGMFAILNESEELLGVLIVEFFIVGDESEEYVSNNFVKENPDIDYEMWLSWQVKDILKSREYGMEFIKTSIVFAKDFYKFRGNQVMCSVRDEDEATLELYKEIGFKIFSINKGEDGNIDFWMRKKI